MTYLEIDIYIYKYEAPDLLYFIQVYLENLPSGENYEKSFMHRDIVTHVSVTKSDFIITASQDGHIKFWKKLEVRHKIIECEKL